jgi:hypothetical protein
MKYMPSEPENAGRLEDCTCDEPCPGCLTHRDDCGGDPTSDNCEPLHLSEDAT